MPEISAAIYLAQLGITAGGQADEIQGSFEIFKIHSTSKNT